MGKRKACVSVKSLEALWEQYKDHCDHQKVLTYNYSASSRQYVEQELQKCIAYTIEGFCVYAGMSRAAFRDRYEGDPKFADLVTRMREECEVDAWKKFELQLLPPQLAGRWMDRYGGNPQDIEEDAALKRILEAVQDVE